MLTLRSHTCGGRRGWSAAPPWRSPPSPRRPRPPRPATGRARRRREHRLGAGSSGSSPTGWCTTTSSTSTTTASPSTSASRLDAIGGHAAPSREISRRARPRTSTSWITGVDFGDPTTSTPARSPRRSCSPRSPARTRALRRRRPRQAAQRRGSATTAPIAAGSRTSRPAATSPTPSARRSPRRGWPTPASRRPAPAPTFLLKQQCDAGLLPAQLRQGKAAAEQTCDAGSETAASPDTDVTALAVLSLLALPQAGRRRRRAIDDATDWLARAPAEEERQLRRRPATEATTPTAPAWPPGRSATPAPAGGQQGGPLGARAAGRRQPLPARRSPARRARSPTTEAAQGGPQQPTASTTTERDQWRRATAQARRPAVSGAGRA